MRALMPKEKHTDNLGSNDKSWLSVYTNAVTLTNGDSEPMIIAQSELTSPVIKYSTEHNSWMYSDDGDQWFKFGDPTSHSHEGIILSTSEF